MRGQNMSYITIDCLNDDDLNLNNTSKKCKEKVSNIYCVLCLWKKMSYFISPKLVNQKTYLKVGCWFGVAATARGLVKKVTEDVEEEEDGEQVQEGEEALVVVERAVVGDDLAGEERHADDHQQERVQTRARDEQTRPEHNKYFCSPIENIFTTS